MKCERCGKQTNIHIMSMFNTQDICGECKAAEEDDPRYQEARKADEDAIRAGNFNFPGIGWKGKQK